jgi:hypothetical protein
MRLMLRHSRDCRADISSFITDAVFPSRRYFATPRCRFFDELSVSLHAISLPLLHRFRRPSFISPVSATSSSPPLSLMISFTLSRYFIFFDVSSGGAGFRFSCRRDYHFSRPDAHFHAQDVSLASEDIASARFIFRRSRYLFSPRRLLAPPGGFILLSLLAPH